MHDYLQKMKILPCAMNNTNTDSECRKLFFRTFEDFLAPGLEVRKSQISRVEKKFWKSDTFLTIFSKSAIFNVP